MPEPSNEHRTTDSELVAEVRGVRGADGLMWDVRTIAWPHGVVVASFVFQDPEARERAEAAAIMASVSPVLADGAR